MAGAALVLSVVDSRTGAAHLFAVETAALHRRSGRYPALCEADVIAASLTTAPASDCQDCITRVHGIDAGVELQREPVRSRRVRFRWPRRARGHGDRHGIQRSVRTDQ